VVWYTIIDVITLQHVNKQLSFKECYENQQWYIET